MIFGSGPSYILSGCDMSKKSPKTSFGHTWHVPVVCWSVAELLKASALWYFKSFNKTKWIESLRNHRNRLQNPPKQHDSSYLLPSHECWILHSTSGALLCSKISLPIHTNSLSPNQRTIMGYISIPLKLHIPILCFECPVENHFIVALSCPPLTSSPNSHCTAWQSQQPAYIQSLHPPTS